MGDIRQEMNELENDENFDLNIAEVKDDITKVV